jgi:Trk K+ transport system NAD-binding subunit
LEVGEILVIGGTPSAVQNAGELGHLLPGEGPILVLGYGEVGRKLVQLLRDVGEDVCVLDKVEREGVDVVGDAMDRAALEKAKIMEARAVIVAVGSDSATLFVTSIVRSAAPDVRVIVRVDREYNVDRIRQVGADFALSLGQVAGQLIGHHLIGDDFLSLGPEHRMVAVGTKGLVGKNPRTDRIAARTGCTIVAVRRGESTIAVFDDAFVIEEGDAVYVWGEPDAIRQHFER